MMDSFLYIETAQRIQSKQPPSPVEAIQESLLVVGHLDLLVEGVIVDGSEGPRSAEKTELRGQRTGTRKPSGDHNG
jgi:hypothetical protein